MNTSIFCRYLDVYFDLVITGLLHKLALDSRINYLAHKHHNVGAVAPNGDEPSFIAHFSLSFLHHPTLSLLQQIGLVVRHLDMLIIAIFLVKLTAMCTVYFLHPMHGAFLF